MVSKNTRCQAFALSSQNQCSKKPLPGSRYCFWHQSWGTNIFGAIIVLVAGAMLSPIVSDSYRYFLPSQEFVALSSLDEKVEGIDKNSEERDKVQSQKLDEVLARQGNEKARSEYLSDLKELSRLYAEKMVAKPDDELLKRQKESREKIEYESQKKANLYELKWEPIRHFILTLLDGELLNWKPKGYLSEVEKKDIPVVVAEKQIIQGSVRQYHLTDDSNFWIWQESGRIEAGKLLSSFQFRFYFGRPQYPNKMLFRIDFYSDRSVIRRTSNELDIEDFTSMANDPMEDKEFMDKMAIAIKLTVNYAIVHSGINLK